MRRTFLPILALGIVASCGNRGGGGDGSGVGGSSVVIAKLRDCGFISAGELNIELGGADACTGGCVAEATCNEIRDTLCMTSDALEARCRSRCPMPEFTCDDGERLPVDVMCDGISDCADGSDEPPGCPPPPMFTCGDGEMVLEDDRCDGFDDCTDASDEVGCPGTPCADGVGNGVRCDLDTDCADRSDEEGCATFTLMCT